MNQPDRVKATMRAGSKAYSYNLSFRSAPATPIFHSAHITVWHQRVPRARTADRGPPEAPQKECGSNTPYHSVTRSFAAIRLLGPGGLRQRSREAGIDRRNSI
jgi:hypothetical protein